MKRNTLDKRADEYLHFVVFELGIPLPGNPEDIGDRGRWLEEHKLHFLFPNLGEGERMLLLETSQLKAALSASYNLLRRDVELAEARKRVLDRDASEMEQWFTSAKNRIEKNIFPKLSISQKEFVNELLSFRWPEK